MIDFFTGPSFQEGRGSGASDCACPEAKSKSPAARTPARTARRLRVNSIELPRISPWARHHPPGRPQVSRFSAGLIALARLDGGKDLLLDGFQVERSRLLH